MGLFDVWKTLFDRKKGKKAGPRNARRTVKSTPKKVKKKPQEKITKKISPKTKKAKEKEIGVITHYFRKISVGIIKLKGPLAVGDKIHIKGAHDDFSQIIKSMQFNHKDISRAQKGLEVGIKVKQRVHENDKVYKASET